MQWSGVAQLANFSESNVYYIIYQIKLWKYETTKTINLIEILFFKKREIVLLWNLYIVN